MRARSRATAGLRAAEAGVGPARPAQRAAGRYGARGRSGLRGAECGSAAALVGGGGQGDEGLRGSGLRFCDSVLLVPTDATR